MSHSAWHWLLTEDSVLHPWLEDASQRTIVKSSPMREVFTAYDAAGNQYHVKHTRPICLADRLVWKLKREYVVARQLRQCGLPCPEHLAWGHCGHEEILVTATVPQARTGIAVLEQESDESKRQRLLEKFAELAGRLWQAGFYHLDMHLGNVLVDSEGKLWLVDLNGVRKRPWPDWLFGRRCLVRFLAKFTSFANLQIDALRQQFGELLLHSGIVGDRREAQSIIQQCADLRQAERRRKLPKRRAKALKGEYFCSALTSLDGMPLHRRISPGGEILPYNLESPLNLTLPHDDAQEYWLTGLLEPEKLNGKPRPTAWLLKPDGNDLIIFP